MDFKIKKNHKAGPAKAGTAIQKAGPAKAGTAHQTAGPAQAGTATLLAGPPRGGTVAGSFQGGAAAGLSKDGTAAALSGDGTAAGPPVGGTVKPQAGAPRGGTAVGSSRGGAAAGLSKDGTAVALSRVGTAAGPPLGGTAIKPTGHKGTAKAGAEREPCVRGRTTSDPTASDATGLASTSSSPGGRQESGWRRVGRSGAQRKKRQKLRQQVALEGTPTGGPSKRPRAVLSSDSGDMAAKRMKTQGQSSSTGSFRDAVAAVKLAIVAVRYPEEYLKAEDLMPIQELIIEKLEEAPDPLPVFTVAPGVVAGAVHVSCDDSDAACWFRGAIHNVELGSLKLKVVNAKDLPKPVKMAWKSRNLALQDSARAIRLLQRLNPALRTDDWKVVHALTEQTGIRRIVLMDGVSAGVIKAAGYSLPGGIERYSFKLLEEDKGEAPTAEAGVEPSEDGPPKREEAIDEVAAHDAAQEAEIQTGASEADLEDDILEGLDTLGIESPTALEEDAMEEEPQN